MNSIAHFEVYFVHCLAYTI